MSDTPSNSSHNKPHDHQNTSGEEVPEIVPTPTLVDEFGHPYPEKPNPAKPKKSRVKKLTRKVKKSKYLNIWLTTIIAISAIFQTVNSCNNNSSTAQQADQLIAAAKISAISAQQSTYAAREFASSAKGINGGVGDAAERLRLQASETGALAEYGSKQTELLRETVALQRQRDFNADPLGVIIVRDSQNPILTPKGVYFDISLRNDGTGAAANVRVAAKMFIQGQVPPNPPFRASDYSITDPPNLRQSNQAIGQHFPANFITKSFLTLPASPSNDKFYVWYSVIFNDSDPKKVFSECIVSTVEL